MASGKKIRKQTKVAKKTARPAVADYRHPDGDRRRRGGPSAKQACRDKKLRCTFPGATNDK